jgi:hypothetical protein
MEYLFPAIAWAILIGLLEFVMWKLFSLKVIKICFPGDHDLKLFHFLTIARLRLIVILHTVVLIATVVIFHFLLW